MSVGFNLYIPQCHALTQPFQTLIDDFLLEWLDFNFFWRTQTVVDSCVLNPELMNTHACTASPPTPPFHTSMFISLCPFLIVWGSCPNPINSHSLWLVPVHWWPGGWTVVCWCGSEKKDTMKKIVAKVSSLTVKKSGGETISIRGQQLWKITHLQANRKKSVW